MNWAPERELDDGLDVVEVPGARHVKAHSPGSSSAPAAGSAEVPSVVVAPHAELPRLRPRRSAEPTLVIRDWREADQLRAEVKRIGRANAFARHRKHAMMVGAAVLALSAGGVLAYATSKVDEQELSLPEPPPATPQSLEVAEAHHVAAAPPTVAPQAAAQLAAGPSAPTERAAELGPGAAPAPAAAQPQGASLQAAQPPGASLQGASSQGASSSSLTAVRRVVRFEDLE